eukprot:gene8302-5817_t
MFRLCSSLLAKTLVVAEVTAGGRIAPATLSAVTAALAVGGPVAALVAGSRTLLDTAAAELASVKGLTEVLQVEGEHFDGKADEVSQLVDAIVEQQKMSHVLAGCTAFGRDVIPLAAAKQQIMPITDILHVKSEHSFVRSMYAGNVVATLESSSPIKYITVRSTSFQRAPAGQPLCPVTHFPPTAPLNRTKIVSESTPNADAPDLTTAGIVIAGGRGMKTKENYEKLFPLAKKLNAAVGATRAAVDSGFAPNENQVGQTGKNVAPALYIGFGVSGAIQHIAGIRDSKVIVAVNMDEEAPLFQAADFILVGDAVSANNTPPPKKKKQQPKSKQTNKQPKQQQQQQQKKNKNGADYPPSSATRCLSELNGQRVLFEHLNEMEMRTRILALVLHFSRFLYLLVMPIGTPDIERIFL